MRKSCFTASLICLIVISASSQQKLTIQLADSLYNLRDYKGAIPAYSHVLKESPNNALAWNRLGYCYHNSKEYDKAIEIYTTALKYEPAPQMLPILYSRLARIYSLKNEKDKAFEYLDKANTSGYGYFNELNELDDYKNIRKDPRFAKVLSTTTGIAFPCMISPKTRAFDFWVGEWDVYLTQNPAQKVGFNKIVIQPGGCSLLESWEGAGYPHAGQSINFYNSTTDRWEQLWVGSSFGQGNNINRFYDGEIKENAIQFKWDPKNMGAKKSIGRFTFTNIAPGKVTQHLETSPDDGKTWQTVYNFTYIRRN